MTTAGLATPAMCFTTSQRDSSVAAACTSSSRSSRHGADAASKSMPCRARLLKLLNESSEVDPLASPTCRVPRQILRFISQALVIDQILAHHHSPRPRSACAAVPPRRHRGPRRSRVIPNDRRPNGPRGAPARRTARRRPLAAAAREARDRGLHLTHFD